MGRLIDLTGNKIGKLYVVERAPNDFIDCKGYHRPQWICKCDCGNTVIISSANLKITRSCGCLIGESAHNRFKKYNKYDLSGEYGIGYTQKNEEFYFDLEDYDKIKDYCWYIRDGYIVSYDTNQKRIISMHRLLFNFPDGLVIDHINHLTTDNRKCNLRVVTHSQNLRNIKKNFDTKIGATGVNWKKDLEKWQAKIKINYKEINLGYFDNFEDALNARKEAEIKYFGEYRYQEV